MPKITAYKCPFTKKLFETRSGYRRHLLKLRVRRSDMRKNRKLARHAQQLRQEKFDVIMSQLNAARTIPEIEQAYIDHFPQMMAYSHNKPSAHWFEMLKFDLKEMRYSNSVSNTHACPRNGVTNWGGRDEGAPRGYPGFQGHIEYTVKEPKRYDGPFWDISNAVGRFGVHTGTGGGRGDDKNGNRRYYYDVKIFLADFPGLAEHVEEVHQEYKKEIFQKKLKGERISKPVYDKILVDI